MERIQILNNLYNTLTEEEKATADKINSLINEMNFDKVFDNLNDLAFQITAYHNGFMIDLEKAFAELLAVPVIDNETECNIINSYNNYLSENNYEEYFENDEDTINQLFRTPAEAIRACYFGDYKFSEDYFQFNGYGNLQSYSSSEIVDEAKTDDGFITYYLDENFDNFINNQDIRDLLIKFTAELLRAGY